MRKPGIRIWIKVQTEQGRERGASRWGKLARDLAEVWNTGYYA